MNQYSRDFLRVNKTKARRLFNEGKTIYLVPCKVYPDPRGMWIQPYDIDKKFDKTFDTIVNSYEYYNCCPETGKVVAFYIKTGEEKP